MRNANARRVFWALAAVSAVAGSAAAGPWRVVERGKPCVARIDAPDGTRVTFRLDGQYDADVVAAGGVAEYRFDTSPLRNGDYFLEARIMDGERLVESRNIPVGIVPAHDDERIPVWRWGGGGCDPEWWSKRGFTGAFLVALRDEPNEKSARDMERMLDRAARYDFELGFYFHTLDAKRLTNDENVLCLLPNGTRDPEKPYPMDPAVLEYTQAVTEAWMARFFDHPGLRHVMFNSEWQTPFCVNDAAVAMARADLDIDLREFVPDKTVRADEVRDGIIDDDNPRYRFLQWWWQRGHGTAPLDRAQSAIVKKYNPDLVTWHEPYRLAPIRGSHAGLDCIATWTYGHPDIKRLCYTTYLQAAARPEGQLVQQDITLFVYGRYAMPLGDSTADLARDFAGKDPYFTAGPDFAREAIWLVLSQRPDILCFYSAGSLSPDAPTQDPFYASPETFDAIGESCEVLVKPYGPAIRGCRRLTPKTALLMSAAATWFPSGPRLPGYPNEQTLPFATLLMMNHVPFDVLLDEDIVEGALDRYALLVMPRADTLTRGMHARIAAFLERGGRVVADASLRANLPGAETARFDFTHQLRIDGHELAEGDAVTAEEDRTIMEGYAAELARSLETLPRPASANTPRVLTNSLEGGQARYHFFVNDERTYGPRFGQWRLHFELGAPQKAELSVALDERPALYDALRRELVSYEERDGRAVLEKRLPAARGALIVALPERIGAVAVGAPASSAAGIPIEVVVKVLGESGTPLPCVLPLRIEVYDALDRLTEWRRYTATKDGVRVYSFVPATNDVLGEWRVHAADLVAGKSAEATIVVAPGGS